jgi:hypothetical protein
MTFPSLSLTVCGSSPSVHASYASAFPPFNHTHASQHTLTGIVGVLHKGEQQRGNKKRNELNTTSARSENKLKRVNKRQEERPDLRVR